MVTAQYIKPLEYSREDFPEGDAGLRDYWRYFISVMFAGYAGNSIRQTTAMVTGQLGTGKTTFLAAVAWWMKEIFNMQVTSDTPSLNRKTFGDYTYLSDFDLVSEVIKAGELADTEQQADLDSSKLYKRIVIWDELYKKAARRRSLADINLIVGDILKQQRHFQSVFLLAAPAENEIDPKNVSQYVTVDVSGIKSVSREDVTLFKVYNRLNFTEAWMEIYLPNYWPLFDSFSPPTMRPYISIKDMTKVIKKGFCVKCNKEFDMTCKFCGVCGDPLKRASFCPNQDCRSLIMPKYKFCPKCGAENQEVA